MHLTYENGSSTVFKIVLELCLGFAREVFKRSFRNSDVSASYMLTASHGFVRIALSNMFMNLSGKMQPLAVKKDPCLGIVSS